MELFINVREYIFDILFKGNDPLLDLFSFNGDLINFTFTTTTLGNILTIIIIGLFFYTAYFVVKWFINFILSIGGSK